MVNMKIDHFVVGPVQTNCYFVTNIKTKEMIIIDPGACANQLAKKVMQSRSQTATASKYISMRQTRLRLMIRSSMSAT